MAGVRATPKGPRLVRALDESLTTIEIEVLKYMSIIRGVMAPPNENLLRASSSYFTPLSLSHYITYFNVGS